MTNPVLPGLCSVSFRALTPGALVRLAVDAGLAAIEWGGDVHVPLGDEAVAAEVAARCAAAGLACPSYGTYLGVDGEANAADACRTAVALGADHLRIWTPPGTDKATTPDERAPVAAEARAIAAEADRHALTVGLEFHGGTMTHTAASTVALLDEVDAPNLFAYWQPVYWDPAVNLDAQRQLAEIDTIGEHLCHLHVYWWHGSERLPLAAGEATWGPSLRLAGRAGRWNKARYAFLEFVPGDDPDLLTAEATTLRRLLG